VSRPQRETDRETDRGTDRGTDRLSEAPHPSFRLIPSRFPPIGLFDTVATAADLKAAMELAGWTNDRLVAERVARLPREDWVHGRPNASIVMAAFLHVPPGGNRFNGPDLGTWYAAAAFPTAAAEVAHHLRREAVATANPLMRRQFRCYQALLDGAFLDIRGERAIRPEVYDPAGYAASQGFGEATRASGGHGIVWDSIRHTGGACAVAFRPPAILEVTQTDHVEITVTARLPRIEVRRLGASPQGQGKAE
jgi:RES domain